LQNFNLQFAGEGFYELGEVRLHMGDLAGAEDAFRQAHELGRTPQPGLGLLRLAEGKADAAFSSIRRALDDPSLDRLHRARLIPGLVEAALAVDELDAARAAVQEFEKIIETYHSPALQASSLCARGALELAQGNARAAIASLQQSVKRWREADLPYEGARARMALGAALEADGDRDAARLELQAAKRKFEELGAVIDLRRVLEMLGDDVGEGLPKASGPVVRLTKTFMFTDIVGSTKLAEAIGDDAWGDLLGWHDKTLRRLIADHRGEEVKQVGDGFFVAFDHSLDAIECAVEIQKHLAEHGKTSGFAPRVRIGLHSADASRKGGDYEGKGVHAAARIGALAQGGEVLVSEEVAASGSRFPISEFRTVTLKGLDDPLRVAALDAG
jgi:class 3 adenylate cyclase